MRVRRQRTRGQSLVEFALAAPLLALVLIGLAEFGFVLYAHVQVANATREAARAGGLYLSARFHYSGCISQPGHPCPTNYGNGGDCWDFRPWVENALVQHLRQANGCDLTGYDTTVHAFGTLNPVECGGSVTTNCWTLETLSVGGTSAPSGGASDVTWITSHIGAPLEITVRYRYEMPFVGNLLGILRNPVDIRKTVIMRVQNN